MTRILKRFRSSFLENAKFQKYLLYAFGEIILVMIGILLALQVNNWNESRKENILEKQLLESLKIDLQKNKKELNRVLEKSIFTHETIDTLLKIYNNQIPDLDLEVHATYLLDATGYTVYSSSEGTITDIMGSGILGVIKNDSIRIAVGSWEANQKSLREWEKLSKQTTDAYMLKIYEYLDVYKEGFGSLLNSVERERMGNDRIMLNHLNDRFHLTLMLNELYRKELSRLNRLAHLIESEL